MILVAPGRCSHVHTAFRRVGHKFRAECLPRQAGAARRNCVAVVPRGEAIVTFGSVLPIQIAEMMIAAAWFHYQWMK